MYKKPVVDLNRVPGTAGNIPAAAGMGPEISGIFSGGSTWDDDGGDGIF
jgi:hypothetical protein